MIRLTTLIEQFEAETGIKVNYDIYDSSEVVDVKLLAGNSGYDVVVHSNQFSSRLAPIGIFEKLDFSRLPNIRHLDPDVMERIRYDAVAEYNVPYHWGSTGYAWNVEMVRERLPDHPVALLFRTVFVNQVIRIDPNSGKSLGYRIVDLFGGVSRGTTRHDNQLIDRPGGTEWCGFSNDSFPAPVSGHCIFKA